MTKLEKIIDFTSKLCYVFSLMTMPLNRVHGYLLIILAIIFSAISRNRTITRNGKRSFFQFWIPEEEAMCICSLFLMIFSGDSIKPLFGLTLIIWAALNVCAWGDSILESNP
jgi:hypothetical protein